MKGWRIVTVLLLCLVLVGSIACNPLGSNKPEVTQQLVEVVRGDLTVTVSGSGNLGVSNEIKLAFGVGGRVDKIYVEEGDEVSQGDVLAKLDTDALELALAQARVAYTQAQVAVTQAQVNQTQSQVARQTAEYNLNQALKLYTWPEIKTMQADVDNAKAYVDYTSWNLSQATTAENQAMWTQALYYARARLAAAEAKLDAMIRSYDTDEVAIKRRQLEAAQQSLELAGQSLELAEQSLKLTEQSLKLARKQLGEATVTAPFDGVVARVSADEKDTVSAATTIIHLIDPSSMKLSVEVDEIDITGVKPGQRAAIEVDALPTLALEGKVSSISLLPTPTAGVVVYDVKIKFDVPEGIGLRAGMSATADIIIAERSNVRLVPDRAINQDSQGNTTVEVMVNGQIEERTVVIGISDGYQTEIIDGLSEGEVVVERQGKPKPSGLGFFGK